MGAKTVPSFVIVQPVSIVIENPTCVFLATRIVDNLTGLVVSALPEPDYFASSAMSSPECCVYMAASVERNHDLIAVLRRSSREFL